MPNLRANNIFPDLEGHARKLAIGRQIESLRADGHEYERVSGLMGLTLGSTYTYSNLWRAHLRQTQPTRRPWLGGTAGNKE